MNMAEFDTRAATAALRLEYVQCGRLESRPASWWRNVLGVVGFDHPPAADDRAPIAVTMTPMLGSDTDVCEVWSVADADAHGPLELGRHGRVHYRFNEDLLFGSLCIDEQEVFDPALRAAGHHQGGAEALLRAAEIAYEEVFAVLEATQHHHLIRIWNYLPEINVAAGGEERYRLFNAARQAAFRKSGRATIGSVPAACALGSPAGARLCVYFLAARRPATTIENPRQTSAYHYPPKFGRHSPTFSRACIFGGAHANLFISGTASIVGHETMHHGDPEAQTRETLANIKALLDEANRLSGGRPYALNSLKLKVYVRRPADLPIIQGILSRELSAASPIYLKADICREDLLVEIEATGEAGSA
jgi:enamine deaminase RidA (YjgF/YER057c/UK114 family)